MRSAECYGNLISRLVAVTQLSSGTTTTTTFTSAMDSEESFARLVHSANPAAHNRSLHYPPTSNAIDPFFDDDDLLDSAPPPANHLFAMHSQESGLPFAHSAAPPAGLGPSTVSLNHAGQPRGWSDDAFQGSASFPGVPSNPNLNTPGPRRRKKWKWPWDKEVVLTGERVITLNNPLMNADFADNFVSTSKYNTVTFLPKFLKGNSLHRHTLFVTHAREQSNSPNTLIYSSSSPPAFSRYQMSPPQTSTPQSYRSPSSSSRPLSRKSKKTTLVPPSFPLICPHSLLETASIRLGAQRPPRQGTLPILYL